MDIPNTDPDPNAPYHKMYTTLFKAITAALYMMEDSEFPELERVRYSCVPSRRQRSCTLTRSSKQGSICPLAFFVNLWYI